MLDILILLKTNTWNAEKYQSTYSYNVISQTFQQKINKKKSNITYKLDKQENKVNCIIYVEEGMLSIIVLFIGCHPDTMEIDNWKSKTFHVIM